MAKLTLIGLYNYDPTLFDPLTVPAGIDKQTLVDNILLRGSEFECIYPAPDFCKFAIGVWSRKNQWTFEKWVKALSIEYEPLNNYDRTEVWEENGKEERKTDSTSSGSSSGRSGTDTEQKKSAYNSATYQPDVSGTSTGTTSSTDKGQVSGTEDSAHSSTRKGRAYGNIGVTTSQQMLQSELDIARFNLIDQITDLFLAEFVLPIYY